MRLPRTRNLRTWFFFDEVHALHRLPAIEDGLQTARGFGGAFVLGIHSFAKLSETYGKEGAQNLASLARTKLILGAADRDTAEHCSDFIGRREVRRMDEAYSYGYSNIRDAATITPRSDIEPLVIPDDIMKLPSLRGFLVYPEGFDAAHIKLAYKDYPTVAPAYVLRENVEPLGYIGLPANDDSEDSDEDEAAVGGRTQKPDPEIEPERDEEPRIKARASRGKGAAKAQPSTDKSLPEPAPKSGTLAGLMAYKPSQPETREAPQARDTSAQTKGSQRGTVRGAVARTAKAPRELGEGLAPDKGGHSQASRSPPQQAGPELDNDMEP